MTQEQPATLEQLRKWGYTDMFIVYHGGNHIVPVYAKKKYDEMSYYEPSRFREPNYNGTATRPWYNGYTSFHDTFDEAVVFVRDLLAKKVVEATASLADAKAKQARFEVTARDRVTHPVEPRKATNNG